MKNEMKNIIVNATATRASGALTILNQFIANIPSSTSDRYYIFVDWNYRVVRNNENIIYIFVNTVSWLKRILWDIYGLKKWINEHGVLPSIAISLQNTGVNLKSIIPQLIYYHQPFPLTSYRWSFFRKDERPFFLYKNVYPYFVSQYLRKNTHVVVQIPSIKQAFISRFKIDSELVHVIPPDVKSIDYEQISLVNYDDNFIHFIFPATPLIYKNHICLVNSLFKLRVIRPDLLKRIRVHFTFEKSKGIQLWHYIQEHGLEENFIFEGVLPYDKLLGMYGVMRALLFPSFIETFGLPLIEAASAGIPILVSDLPYARDVIGGYEGASFVKYDDISEWTHHIILLCEKKDVYPFYKHEQQESNWDSFFQLVDKLKI